MGIILATVYAFAASSLWYSPAIVWQAVPCVERCDGKRSAGRLEDCSGNAAQPAAGLCYRPASRPPGGKQA